MKSAACPNCGAPMADEHKCEYCGSLFNTAKTGDEVVLILGGEKVRCYLAQTRLTHLGQNATARDMHGRIIRNTAAVKREFILMEY